MTASTHQAPHREPRVEVVLQVVFESVGQLRHEFLTNLSSSGMFLHTQVPLKVGQLLTVYLSLPGVLAPPIPVQVEVRWVGDPNASSAEGAGFAFRSIGPEDKARLEQVLGVSLAAEPARPPPSVHPRLKVLLVESNAVLAEILRCELVRLGGNPRTARSSLLELCAVKSIEEGAAEQARDPASVVIIDTTGLHEDVAAMLLQLRQVPRSERLPVIVLDGPPMDSLPAAVQFNLVSLRKPVPMKPLYNTLVALHRRAEE